MADPFSLFTHIDRGIKIRLKSHVVIGFLNIVTHYFNFKMVAILAYSLLQSTETNLNHYVSQL